MKRYKRVLILAAVLALAVCATVLLTGYEEKQEQIRTSDAVILQLPAESVQELSWEYSTGEGFAFYRTEALWKYREDEAFPVSEEKILEILEPFANYGVTFVIEDVTDFAQYGLDAPVCTLRIKTQEQTYELKMGDFSAMDQQRYISIGDGNVYLVEEDPRDYLSTNLSSMILHDDTPGFEKPLQITFAGAENYTVTRMEDSIYSYAPEEDLYYVQRDGKTLPLDSAAVKTYLNTVTALDLINYVTYAATTEQLQAYHLDEPLLSVTVRYSEETPEGPVEESCLLHIGENREERAASDASEAEGKGALAVSKYVRVGDSSIVYELDDMDYGVLMAAGYDDLRHEQLFWGDFDAVTQLDITLEGQTHTLTYAPKDAEAEEAEYAWFFGEETVELQAVESAVSALRAESFTQAKPQKEQEIGVTMHLDKENFPTVHLQLYRHDGSTCLAVVDGQPVAMVSRSAVVDLVEAVQAIVLAIAP